MSQPAKPKRAVLLFHFRALRRVINSPRNSWFAGERVGHEPTFDEKLRHFTEHEGLADFRKRFFGKYPGALSAIG